MAAPLAQHAVLDTTSSLQAPASPSMQLDTEQLFRYLQQQVSEVLVPGVGHDGGRLLTVHQFGHGQSNPTYRITGAALREPLVLRKKPGGKILPSAHSVEREHAVLSGLAQAGAVPVPRPLALCNDSSVLGTPFYLMSYVQGQIFLDPNLPNQDASTRSDIYRQMAHTLAALHATDVDAVGLSTYGNPSAYCRRQLRRWVGQYRASVAATPPAVAQLIDWLTAHVPASDDQPARPCITHGDYRLDNLVFTPATSAVAAGQVPGSFRLAAVLDWELSTLGDRWADVAYNCLPYHLPAGMPLLARLGPAPGSALPAGIPTEQEYVAQYCAAAGVSPPPPQDWAFYLALSLFRLLAILAGVQARAKQGNASSRVAAAVSSDAVLAGLASAALHVIGTAQPPTPSPASGDNSRGASDVGGPLPPRVAGLLARLQGFMREHVYPAEEVLEAHAAGDTRWTIHPLQEDLKRRAKEAGLWNLWLPGALAARLTHLLPLAPSDLDRRVLLGQGLTNWEYAHLCAVMGRSAWAPELFNCSAPDTGNMEVLGQYGSKEQQVRWLLPLLTGDIRSCFAMTEKGVASSDATNIQASITRDTSGSQPGWVVSGRKWWTSGACDPRCAVAIFMGKTRTDGPKHKQQSMVLVPFDAPGVTVVRPMLVYGFDDAPHGHAEVAFDAVRVPYGNLILGEGRGFEIAQGRLGPGRLHHCMRLVGAAERALELMVTRANNRTVFGKPLSAHGSFRSDLARCRVDWEGARLLVLHAAAALDRSEFKGARGPLAAAKVAAPNMALRVIDTAVQVHGGEGVSQDTVLARLWTAARTLRIADGPDEVHLGTIAGLEMARVSKL